MDVKKQLLLQIDRYLKNEITKEKYVNIAESFYSRYAKCIENTEFDKVFSESIPDACMIYIDEPGGVESEKDSEFRIILEQTYYKLRGL